MSGQGSSGGVLIGGRGVTMAEISDGTSNTIMVAEQSDWLIGPNGEEDCRADCSHGFTMGMGGDP